MSTSVPDVLALDERLAPIRAGLVGLAAHHDILAGALCRCDNPDCVNRTGATVCIGRLLEQLQAEWIADGESSTLTHRIPRDSLDELGVLLNGLGDACDIWPTIHCDCGEPACEVRTPRTARVPLRLVLIAEGWETQGGCLHVAPRADVTIRRLTTRNIRLLDAASHLVSGLDQEQILQVVTDYRAVAATPWFNECNQRVYHALADSWGDDRWEEMFQQHSLAAAGQAVSAFLDEPDAEAFNDALSYFGCAIGVTDLTHVIALAPFLAPFDHAVPLSTVLASVPS